MLCDECTAKHATRYETALREDTPGRRRLHCCICSRPCIEPIEPCGPWPGRLFCAEHHSPLSTIERLPEAVDNARLREVTVVTDDEGGVSAMTVRCNNDSVPPRPLNEAVPVMEEVGAQSAGGTWRGYSLIVSGKAAARAGA